MKRFTWLVTLLTIMLFSSGCWAIGAVATVGLVAMIPGAQAKRLNEAMQSWKGAHFSDLIMSWGPPQSVFEDGFGGRIMVWTEEREWTTRGRATTTVRLSDDRLDGIWARAETTYTTPERYGYTAYRMFKVNQNGYIYGWSWKGT